MIKKIFSHREKLDKHLSSVPIPKLVLYVFVCMLIVKLKQ